MKLLFASKIGFAFLAIAVAMTVLLIVSCRVRIMGVVEHAGVDCTGGMIFLEVLSGSTQFVPEIRIEERLWYWPSLSWPEYYYFTWSDQKSWQLSLPIWTLLLPSALMSWCFYRRAKRKRLIGHCPKCEYDLTGNVSGACPECGARI